MGKVLAQSSHPPQPHTYFLPRTSSRHLERRALKGRNQNKVRQRVSAMPSGKCSSSSTPEPTLNSQPRLHVLQCAAQTAAPWCVAASRWQLAVRTTSENSEDSSRGGDDVGNAESSRNLWEAGTEDEAARPEPRRGCSNEIGGEPGMRIK